ncbi:helix-turn-helix domain-containing protein [Acidimangrovimonas sediminis]|uniref:helix-turn-helix domain-containing protein n=1 Tax=Acidimangrovimonas sediminis TaxID=2056283 RepID=UPI001E367119|nr:helix-turn-helix domain-containing protein [Acidimangrovimonas sediminis]
MDERGNRWHYSCMEPLATPLLSGIPVFNLFGETGAFPDVIHVERIRDRARLHDWKIAPHRHREMAQVFHMLRGAADVRVDGREIALTSGQVLFVPPQAVHGFVFARGAEGHVLSFPAAVTAAIGRSSRALAGRLARPFAGPVGDGAVALIDQLETAFQNRAPLRAELLVALSHALLAGLAAEEAARAAPAPVAGDPRLAAFETLIAQHLAEGWRVADYARALALTPGHLNRLCRAATGETAGHHVETARITEARRLLAFTRIPVAEIGYSLGFADPSYFSRRFRAVCGESPGAYRARLAG